MLLANYYKTEGWFEPILKENKMRRPPKILNIEEGVAQISPVPINTYIFRFDSDPVKVTVLRDKDRRNTGGAGSGGYWLAPKGRRHAVRWKQPRLDATTTTIRRQSGGVQNLAGGGAAADNQEYETQSISANDWNPQQDLTAVSYGLCHRPSSAAASLTASSSRNTRKSCNLPVSKRCWRNRSAILTRGRMPSVSSASRFNAWKWMPRQESQRLGHDHAASERYVSGMAKIYLSSLSSQRAPKYDLIRQPGLWVPLLREFHASKRDASLPAGGMLPGLQPRPDAATASAADKPKPKYPDVVAKLPSLLETLDKLSTCNPSKSPPRGSAQASIDNIFNPDAAPKAQNPAPPAPARTPSRKPWCTRNTFWSAWWTLTSNRANTIAIGSGSRWPIPTTRSDVAAPDYKENEDLTSNEWFEMIRP